MKVRTVIIIYVVFLLYGDVWTVGLTDGFRLYGGDGRTVLFCMVATDGRMMDGRRIKIRN